MRILVWNFREGLCLHGQLCGMGIKGILLFLLLFCFCFFVFGSIRKLISGPLHSAIPLTPLLFYFETCLTTLCKLGLNFRSSCLTLPFPVLQACATTPACWFFFWWVFVVWKRQKSYYRQQEVLRKHRQSIQSTFENVSNEMGWKLKRTM